MKAMSRGGWRTVATVLTAALLASASNAFPADSGPVRLGVTISESVEVTVKKYQSPADYLTVGAYRFIPSPAKEYESLWKSITAQRRK